MSKLVTIPHIEVQKSLESVTTNLYTYHFCPKYPVKHCVTTIQNEDTVVFVATAHTILHGRSARSVRRIPPVSAYYRVTEDLGTCMAQSYIAMLEDHARGFSPMDQGDHIYMTLFHIANEGETPPNEQSDGLPYEMSFVGVKYRDTCLVFHGPNLVRDHEVCEVTGPDNQVIKYRRILDMKAKRPCVYKYLLTYALHELAHAILSKDNPSYIMDVID